MILTRARPDSNPISLLWPFPDEPLSTIVEYWTSAVVMALNRSFTLNTGAKIPAVGFGTWQAAPKEVEKAVEIALKAGYKHIDCAAIYRNESEVGAGIKNSGVPRNQIFLTTKLW